MTTDDRDDEPLVFIVTGKVTRDKTTEKTPFNAVLNAPDDDTAVRQCLEALARQGFEEADLDQIGNLLEKPQNGEFADAYEKALGGEVVLILYPRPDGGQALPDNY